MFERYEQIWLNEEMPELRRWMMEKIAAQVEAKRIYPYQLPPFIWVNGRP